MELINNTTKTLKDDLSVEIKQGSKVSIAAACFSIYAFQELKEQLSQIEQLRFIFTSPTFVTEKAKKERREFYIPRMTRERSLYGTEFEIKLRNELTQKAIARECAEWINSDRVYPIVEQLMQRGIRLWYDDGIEAGSDFREFIAEKIRDSWQVLLFASHESIQPGFVRNEINYALHCGKPILRVNLDDVELTPGMELSLGGMQYVDATEPGGDYLERIVRTLLAERKEKA